jgi:glutamate-1-semialdehyde aminotransferase
MIDAVQFLNTGSEATYQALRTARAATGRDYLIVMQEKGLESLIKELGLEAVVARQGSAFCLYSWITVPRTGTTSPPTTISKLTRRCGSR